MSDTNQTIVKTAKYDGDTNTQIQSSNGKADSICRTDDSLINVKNGVGKYPYANYDTNEMVKPRLHLDADTSTKALHKVLCERGHDVTRTPIEWMPLNADDRTQLLGSSAQGRILFTFNIPDFQALAKIYPEHHGLLLAAQNRWTLHELIDAIDRMLRETEVEEWIGQVRWLNNWKEC